MYITKITVNMIGIKILIIPDFKFNFIKIAKKFNWQQKSIHKKRAGNCCRLLIVRFCRNVN